MLLHFTRKRIKLSDYYVFAYIFFQIRLYSVRVIGVDLSKAAIEWAQKHSIGKFFATDGINLSWIPDNTFHHFYSFGAVCYVPPEKVCQFGAEVVRILKPGGTALFGWLSGLYCKPFGMQPKDAWNCVENLSHVSINVHDDKTLWKSPNDLICNTGSYSVILKLSEE